MQPDNYPSWRDEENLVDYNEIEEPATFSPAEEDNYSDGDGYPAHRDGPEDDIDNTDDFPAYPAEGADSVGGKRSQNVFQEEERARKSTRSVGVGSPQQADDNQTTYHDRVDLAALPTGGRRSGSAFTALPSGGSGNAGINPVALPSGGSSDARRTRWRGRRICWAMLSCCL